MSLRGFCSLSLLLILGSCAYSQEVENVQLVGAGTTGPFSLYSQWFEAFEKSRLGTHFRYIPSGSGTGMALVTSGTADFGATDVPMSEQQLAKAQASQFATAVIAIVPVYNLSGISQPLRFSPRALSGIYLGTVTKWNDAAISASNPGARLPSDDILVIHSTVGRGAAYIWSDYLSKVSAEWRTRVGRGMAVAWPVGRVADGNGNVARMVKETPNSIGFVELAFAFRNHLAYGLVQNLAGNFVLADAASASAAAASVARNLGSNFSASITNAPGENSYPIASFTWIVVSRQMSSPAKQQAMKEFLRWLLHEGADYVEPSGFARLPESVTLQERDAVERLP